MTFATKITMSRILMTPLFVIMAICYSHGLSRLAPNELFRWLAIFLFTLAALTDALDGFVARHFNQCSRLGTFLDPVADKTLMLSVILTLSFTSWGQHLPIWYAALIISRDLIEISGAIVIGYIAKDIRVIHHWTGKIAMFLQIAVIGWVFLFIHTPLPIFLVILSAFLTFIATVLYIRAGLSQLPIHEDAGTLRN
jgi:CDP-diacylglycerol--glycerol-3-phosphate 3-phosphatidyltransferase/cardiolipin synthase